MRLVGVRLHLRAMCVLPLLLLLLATVTAAPPVSSNCSTTFTYNQIPKTFESCASLDAAPGVSIAWTHRDAVVLEVGFTGTAPAATNSWVAWGVNPSGGGGFMGGATVCVARIDAAGVVTVSVANLDGDGRLTPAAPGATVTVTDQAAEVDGTTVKIYASVAWSDQVVFHGWNSGRLVAGAPAQHSLAQQSSKAVVNLTSGETVDEGSDPQKQMKYNHGILAVVSWGILIPIGIMVARYARPFQSCRPAWFYTHIFFQVSGFILGVAAWAMGMKLGNGTYASHRAIGIVIFTLSILQVLALVLRPSLESKKVRPVWNVYHHLVGYVAALLGIVNVFIGFHVLKQESLPKPGYRTGYIAVLAVLGGIAFVLEVFTWMVHIRRKSRIPSQQI